MFTRQVTSTGAISRRQVVKGFIAVPALALGAGVTRSVGALSSGGFQVGDRVIVNTDVLNLRSGPGLGYGVQSTLDYGTYLSILDGPVIADGYSWFQVYDDPEGWVAGEFLLYVATPFQIGDAVTVNTDWLNLRSGQGLVFDVIDVLPYGTEATIIGIPASGSGDGYDWVQIETSGGQVGWVAAEFLTAGGGGGGGGDGTGEMVTVFTDALHFRSSYGLDANIIEVLHWGQLLTISSGPVSADGYDWYEVIFNGQYGWVAGAYLAPATID